MEYKAIFLDVDDTLIGSDKKVSPGNLAAIKRARQAGKLVTIATGRGYKGSSAIWREIGIQGPVIVYGGACVMDTRGGEILFTADIAPSLITEALEFSHELGLIAQIYQGDAVIVEEDNDISRRYVSLMDLPYHIDADIRRREWRDVPKVLAFAPLAQEQEMVQKYRERFQGRLEVASSKPGYIELNRYGSNKGTTMLRLAEQMGFSREELIAVGDNTLDLQMIEMAGLGVCVENGQQVVKDIADVIAPACDADGVKWVIDRYFFGE